ncbi:MAG TPA: ATP-dependent Clp protease proteolytic subunit [Phycisphaerales bacterium]|nr:ATP-dependent Clp protease proteolytic subunit [Phycisphaerales bacterium]
MQDLVRPTRLGWVWLAAIAALVLCCLGLDPAFARPQDGVGKSLRVVPAARQAGNVAIITIEGPITSLTAVSFERRLKLAETSGAEGVVIDLNTPGGELGAAFDICNAIKSSSIKNIVAWVHPNAYSAGAVIALACREIITSGTGTMGDALPIRVSRFGGLSPLPEHEKQKVTAPLLAEVVDSARRHNRDEYLVQGIVALGVELWMVENAKTGERMAVNRAEYEMLFQEQPPAGRPRLVSAPSDGDGFQSRGIARKKNEAGKAKEEALPAEGSEERLKTPSEEGRPGDTTGEPSQSVESTPISEQDAGGDAGKTAPGGGGGGGDGEVTFRPASPTIERFEKDLNLTQDRASQRRTLTPADRGQWKLVEYVSDGKGPFTFKSDDLIHYRLAVEKVDTDEELRAYFGATNLRRLDPNWSEKLSAVLMHPILQVVLIVVFLVGLVLEMIHPGLVAPGSVAALALVLLVAPPLLVGMANWWELAAIGVGILLLAVEVLILPGFGIPGVLGLVLLFVGLVGVFVGPGGGLFPSSTGGRGEMLGGLVMVLLSFVSAGMLIYFISRNLSSIPMFNRMVLRPGGEEDIETNPFEAMAITAPSISAGAEGVALTPLRPSGKAQFGDRVLDVASSIGYVDGGTPVRIVSADGFQTIVEPITGPRDASAG